MYRPIDIYNYIYIYMISLIAVSLGNLKRRNKISTRTCLFLPDISKISIFILSARNGKELCKCDENNLRNSSVPKVIHLLNHIKNLKKNTHL